MDGNGGRHACAATRLDGSACPNAALADSAYCFVHAPERAEERAEARRRGGLHRATATRLPHKVSLRSAAEILKLLEELAGELMVTDTGMSKARSMTLVATTALRCLELDALEARVSALERRRSA